MEDLKLGNIITVERQRDAIHIAVAPVVAAEKLFPGQDVSVANDKATAGGIAPIGIVDPFLRTPVFPEQRFWLFLYPNTITSLRHDWTHPAFGAVATAPEDAKAASEKWLRAFAEHLDIGYNALLEAATEFSLNGERTIQRGSESWRDNFHDAPLFWKHYEIVTGTKVEDYEASPFCCTC